MIKIAKFLEVTILHRKYILYNKYNYAANKQIYTVHTTCKVGITIRRVHNYENVTGKKFVQYKVRRENFKKQNTLVVLTELCGK
jgi:hypothetical protein